MKIFFDTNVLFSVLIARGHAFDVIKDSVYKHEVYYTDYVLRELQDTLLSRFSLSSHVAHAAIEVIKKYFIKGETATNVAKICRNADDDQILTDVLRNDVEVLITGDKDLLVLGKYRHVRIIAPKEYWNL